MWPIEIPVFSVLSSALACMLGEIVESTEGLPNPLATPCSAPVRLVVRGLVEAAT